MRGVEFCSSAGYLRHYVKFDEAFTLHFGKQTDINTFLCYQEKTVSRKSSTSMVSGPGKDTYKRASSGQSHIVLPHATLDLSNGFNGTITAKSLELSTLV